MISIRAHLALALAVVPSTALALASLALGCGRAGPAAEASPPPVVAGDLAAHASEFYCAHARWPSDLAELEAFPAPETPRSRVEAAAAEIPWPLLREASLRSDAGGALELEADLPAGRLAGHPPERPVALKLRIERPACWPPAWFPLGSAMPEPGADAAESASARGAERLAPFKAALQTALREGLAQGPVEAISACRLRAPEIARALSVDGVRIGRSAHRLRNPANAPPDWVAPLLAAYVASDADRAPRSVPLPGGRAGYVEPILTQRLCLTCHGESLAPALTARIAELYPEDRAVGFREGDLRGVFWVELPAER